MRKQEHEHGDTSAVSCTILLLLSRTNKVSSFLALFELALHRHKKDLCDCVRGLLEVGDSRNLNKDCAYFKCSCAMIKHKIRGKSRCLDFFQKVGN